MLTRRTLADLDSAQKRIMALETLLLSKQMQSEEHGRRLAALVKLETAVREYLMEVDNPAPDYVMRRARREKMREALCAI